jgi:hypothetical protein
LKSFKTVDLGGLAGVLLATVATPLRLQPLHWSVLHVSLFMQDSIIGHLFCTFGCVRSQLRDDDLIFLRSRARFRHYDVLIQAAFGCCFVVTSVIGSARWGGRVRVVYGDMENILRVLLVARAFLTC